MDEECQNCRDLQREADRLQDALDSAQEKLDDVTSLVIDLYRLVK